MDTDVLVLKKSGWKNSQKAEAVEYLSPSWSPIAAAGGAPLEVSPDSACVAKPYIILPNSSSSLSS